MYSHPHPHSHAFAQHASPHSHHSHQPLPSYHQHHQRNPSTSHLHVLQNPPQLSSSPLSTQTGNASSSTPSRGHPQPFYPSSSAAAAASSSSSSAPNQELWGGSISNAVPNASGDGHHADVASANTANYATNRTSYSKSSSIFSPTLRSRVSVGSGTQRNGSANGPPATVRPLDQEGSQAGVSSRSKNGALSSSGDEPNWGLIGRQLSQIAGDVATSVRQNGLVISLLERLVERVESAPPLSDSMNQGSQRNQEGSQQERVRLPPRVSMPNNEASSSRTRRQGGGYVAAPVEQETGGRGSYVSVPVSTQSHPPVGPNNAGSGGGGGAGDSNQQVAYIDDSFDFMPTNASQTMANRDHYHPSVQHSYDSSDQSLQPSKRTSPRIQYAVNGGETASGDGPLHSGGYSISTGHESRHHQQQQHLLHSHPVQGEQTGVAQGEFYNRIPSPVFPEVAPTNDEPPPGMAYSQYFSQEEVRGSRNVGGNRRQIVQSGTQTLSPQEIQQQSDHPSMGRPNESSRNRSNVLQSNGSGSLEEAGIIPVSSAPSSATLPTRVSGMEDQSMQPSLGNVTAGDDEGLDPGVEEAANEDWKLWLEPRGASSAARKNVPRAKYQSAKQVKMERKEKTRRSLSTIGRIPLKEYLEVGSEYKAVRRTARSVYNTWLILNVRLAKQDPERLMACYHKLEHDFPILADCEDHWKTKELMLQVIDNAIDEIAFHRRKVSGKTGIDRTGDA